MTIKTEYVLKIISVGHQELVCSFTFNTLPEVKQFLKKLSNTGLMDVSADDAEMFVYRREITWNLTDGVFTTTETKIVTDF